MTEFVNNCAACRFFDRDDDYAGSGECHRNAPIPHSQPDALWVWPRLGAGDWCGQWEIGSEEAYERLRLHSRTLRENVP